MSAPRHPLRSVRAHGWGSEARHDRRWAAGARGVEARRALVLHDRPLVVDLIRLTLNHGLFVVRAADDLAEAESILVDWRPHMTIVDMDHDDSTSLLQRLGAS